MATTRRSSPHAAGRRGSTARAAAGAIALLIAALPAVGGCGPAAATGSPTPRPATQQTTTRAPQPGPSPAPTGPAPKTQVHAPKTQAHAPNAAAPHGAYPAPATPQAVVVGNDPGARPQSGLSRADIVWEILAEGGITRFFAIFATQGAPRIGPVRSTRIYFDQLDRWYGIPFAHAGGNVDALNAVAAWHLASLDQIYGAGAYFWRGKARVAPDNLYTSTRLLGRGIAALRLPAKRLAYPASGAAPPGGTPTRSATLRYWHAADYTYAVSWRWHDGWWHRYVNGAPVSTLAGRPLRAATVIVLAVPQAPDPDPYTPGALKLLWNRGGVAWVLRGGDRYRGIWRIGRDGLPAVLSPGGKPLPAGRRHPYWYQVVPSAGAVSFG